MLRRRFARRALGTRALAFLALATLALGTTSCDLIYGLHDTEVEFPVTLPKNGKFWGWSEITIDGGDVDSVNSATLVDVVLHAPVGTKDLSFLKNIKAEVVNGEERKLVAVADAFPVGQESVRLKVVYKDDLRPLFKTPDTLRVEWSGATNPSFPFWPGEGFAVKAHVVIDVE